MTWLWYLFEKFGLRFLWFRFNCTTLKRLCSIKPSRGKDQWSNTSLLMPLSNELLLGGGVGRPRKRKPVPKRRKVRRTLPMKKRVVGVKGRKPKENQETFGKEVVLGLFCLFYLSLKRVTPPPREKEKSVAGPPPQMVAEAGFLWTQDCLSRVLFYLEVFLLGNEPQGLRRSAAPLAIGNIDVKKVSVSRAQELSSETSALAPSISEPLRAEAEVLLQRVNEKLAKTLK